MIRFTDVLRTICARLHENRYVLWLPRCGRTQICSKTTQVAEFSLILTVLSIFRPHVSTDNSNHQIKEVRFFLSLGCKAGFILFAANSGSSSSNMQSVIIDRAADCKTCCRQQAATICCQLCVHTFCCQLTRHLLQSAAI